MALILSDSSHVRVSHVVKFAFFIFSWFQKGCVGGCVFVSNLWTIANMKKSKTC